MSALKKLSAVMENPTAYRLWQMPFARQKFEPIPRHNHLGNCGRVLDVGCGPGTNAAFFQGTDYLGLDINPEYIRQARRRYGMQFEVADVCTYEAEPDNRFDFILLNSLLHHVDDPHTLRILEQLSRQLTPDGCIHILDLVLPDDSSIARKLALSDRGDHPRSLGQWRSLFSQHFQPIIFEPYDVTVAGTPFWKMVYFKGRSRKNKIQ